jgi:hypothetical protein
VALCTTELFTTYDGDTSNSVTTVRSGRVYSVSRWAGGVVSQEAYRYTLSVACDRLKVCAYLIDWSDTTQHSPSIRKSVRIDCVQCGC